MPAKKLKDNKLALYGVTDGTVADLAEKNSEAKKLAPMLRAKPCSTPEQYKWCSEQFATLRAIRNGLEEQRTNITKPMNAAKRAVDALFSPIKMFDECIEILDTKLRAYDRAQLQNEAAALKLAADAASRGDIAGASAAIDALAPVVEGAGHSTGRTLSFRVTDFSQVSDTFKCIDEAAVKAVIRAWEKSGAVEPPVYAGLEFELDAKNRAKAV